MDRIRLCYVGGYCRGTVVELNRVLRDEVVGVSIDLGIVDWEVLDILDHMVDNLLRRRWRVLWWLCWVGVHIEYHGSYLFRTKILTISLIDI